MLATRPKQISAVNDNIDSINNESSKSVKNDTREQIHQQSQPQVVHNYNVYGNNIDNSIIVKHDKTEQKFTLFNANNQVLGGFNILQLFKFLNKKHDFYLVDITIGSSDIIIKKYLYDDDKDINREYELLSHTESAFTGNVELLVKLYSDIIKVEDVLDRELLNKPKEIAEDIQKVNTKFIYNLLIRLLKLINTISDTVQDKSVKENLLKYSVGAIYKISLLIKDDITIKKMQMENVNDDINKLQIIHTKMNEKIEQLESNINTQNKTIDNLVLELNTYNKNSQQGGNKSTSTSTSTSSYVSDSGTTSKSKSTSTSTSTYTTSYVSPSDSKSKSKSTSTSNISKNNTETEIGSTSTITAKDKSELELTENSNKTKSHIQSYKVYSDKNNTNRGGYSSTSQNDISLTITNTETEIITNIE